MTDRLSGHCIRNQCPVATVNLPIFCIPRNWYHSSSFYCKSGCFLFTLNDSFAIMIGLWDLKRVTDHSVDSNSTCTAHLQGVPVKVDPQWASSHMRPTYVATPCICCLVSCPSLISLIGWTVLSHDTIHLLHFCTWLVT